MDHEKYKYVLSSGLIKRLSTEEFKYQLSLNAFNALNNEVQKYLNQGTEVVKINRWIMKILKGASEYLDDKFDGNESKIRMRIWRLCYEILKTKTKTKMNLMKNKLRT